MIYFFYLVVFINKENIAKAISAKTKLVWVETPTNPLMNITDIAAVAAITKANKCLLCVDNTFASPYLQNPLDLGADIVMHSATKYLGGHSDVIQGCLVVNDKQLRDDLYFIQKSCGAVPGPQDCFLVLRGIKTLHVRMQRHCENGEKIAHWLRNHPKVAKVYWPGFTDHPNHEIAKKQMKDAGGLFSIVLRANTVGEVEKFCNSLKRFLLAVSWGGHESLVIPSVIGFPANDFDPTNVNHRLIRFYIGLEDPDYLIEDLKRGLNSI